MAPALSGANGNGHAAPAPVRYTARDLAEQFPALHADRIEGGWYIGRCPCHTDDTVLRFQQKGDGAGIRFNCQYGCRSGAIAPALGIPVESVEYEDAPRQAATRKIVMETPPASPPPTAEPEKPKTVQDYLREWHALLRADSGSDQVVAESLADHITAMSAVDHIDALASVPQGQRHHPEHIDQYWLFLARVAEEEAQYRPALLAEASRRRLFPGKTAKDFEFHLAQWLAPEPKVEETLSPEVLNGLREQAAAVLYSNDPLDAVDKELRKLGWGGDRRPLLVLYLAGTSRLLEPRHGSLLCHTQVNGPAGSGKSFAIGVFLMLFPPSTFVKYVATSQKVLLHDPVSLKHKLVVYAEADSLPGVAHGEEDNPAASWLRTLLQDGTASYKIPIKDRETGKWTIHEIVKEGPAVLIVPTVNRLGKTREQLDSRLFALDIPEDPEQQDAAMRAQDKLEVDETIPEVNPALLAFQSYLQAIAPVRVVVPYIRALSDLMRRGRIDSRLLRDRARLLSLIKAVTIIRHAKRALDKPNGRFVATLEDYATVADLLAEMYENTVTEATPKMRELVAAVGQAPSRSLTGIAAHLGINKSAAHKRIKAALANGWLYNTETREGHPMSLRVGEPLPHPCGLPSVEQIRTWKPLRKPVR